MYLNLKKKRYHYMYKSHKINPIVQASTQQNAKTNFNKCE